MSALKRFTFSAVALFAFSTTGLAGQPACARHDELVKLLDSKYSEEVSGMGIVGESSVVEVFVSEKGTFTVISTNTKGVACIIAAGQGWEKYAPQKHLSSL